MAQKIKPDLKLLDVLAFLTAALYMQSVLTVAHHTSHWAHNGTTHIVDAPAVPALVIGLLLSGYSWHKSGAKPSTLVVISLTVLATASLFWLSGLRTNFYF